MAKEIPANVRAQIIAELGAHIAQRDAWDENFRSEQKRREGEMDQRRRQTEAETRLRELARELGFEIASVTLR
jgi:hypothetical protein